MQSAPTAQDRADTLVEDDTAADGLVPDPLVADELLIEEISIDGMCGVY